MSTVVPPFRNSSAPQPMNGGFLHSLISSNSLFFCIRSELRIDRAALGPTAATPAPFELFDFFDFLRTVFSRLVTQSHRLARRRRTMCAPELARSPSPPSRGSSNLDRTRPRPSRVLPLPPSRQFKASISHDSAWSRPRQSSAAQIPLRSYREASTTPKWPASRSPNEADYISTAQQETEIDLTKTHAELLEIEKTLRAATKRHNEFLRELGLPLLP